MGIYWVGGIFRGLLLGVVCVTKTLGLSRRMIKISNLFYNDRVGPFMTIGTIRLILIIRLKLKIMSEADCVEEAL